MRYFILFFAILSINSYAQKKVFHQPHAKGVWQYVYPFADKNYVFAVQYGVKDGEEDGLKTSNIYFGKIGKTDEIFWKEQVQMRLVPDNINFKTLITTVRKTYSFLKILAQEVVMLTTTCI